jgi:hypothetical protein
MDDGKHPTQEGQQVFTVARLGKVLRESTVAVTREPLSEKMVLLLVRLQQAEERELTSH